jgi:hypothetical protein
MYISLVMTAKRHQQSVTVTVLEIPFSYGELRGWNLMRGEIVLLGKT